MYFVYHHTLVFYSKYWLALSVGKRIFKGMNLDDYKKKYIDILK